MSATESRSAVLGSVPYPITREVADRFIGEASPPDRAAVAMELVRLVDGWEEISDILRAYDAAARTQPGADDMTDAAASPAEKKG